MSLENQLLQYSSKFTIKRPSEDTGQYVYRILSSLILNMILKPGQRMNEQELSSFMHVSRTPLHDAFPRLSRNNLIEIIPMKGSFVSHVNKKRIENSIWLNEQICVSMIQGIFITGARKSELDILYEILSQMNYNNLHGDFLRAQRSLVQFYKHLFILGGNFNTVWLALYESEADLFRLYSLAFKYPIHFKEIFNSFSALTDALINRENDLACRLFSAHMNYMLNSVNTMSYENPGLFNEMIS